MKEKDQIKKYKQYIKEYISGSISINENNIREDLIKFKRHIKAAVKVALEDAVDDYGSEGIYMLFLSYLYQFDNSYFWSVVNTEKSYKELIKDKDKYLMYYRYSPEESPNWEAGSEAFEIMNKEFVNIVKKQDYDKDRCDEDETFWDSFEFDDFYDELEEACLQSLNEIREEGFLKKLNLENIMFQFYVRDQYSMEKDIEMFKRINQGNDEGIEGFVKSFE